jgi:Spy/CpxP family protein refolding chaperone
MLQAVLLSSALAVFAQPSPYTDRVNLPVKALSEDAMKAYRDGTGMGLAIPAELNGYPGPRHLLDMAGHLELTDAQKASLQAIFDPMHADAVRLGGEIIDLERKLDEAFARGTASDDEVRTLTREIASRQGQLRFVHLKAHIATKKVLNADQIAMYEKMRGYMGDHGGEHTHH